MIVTLAISLSMALVLGMIAQKLRLSTLVGYLLAGILAAQLWGEQMNHELVEDFSHIGVVLLLFGVGLHFHFKDLVAVQRLALPTAIVSMVMRTAIVGAAAWWLGDSLGLDVVGCAMFGVCASVTSTVVLTRVLADNRLLQTPAGHTGLGILVVEDIFTILMLVLMPVLFGDKPLLESLLWMVVKLALLVVCVVYIGDRVIAKVLTSVSRFASGELFTLSVLVFALGIAALSSYVFDASMEFGAFLSGMVVGQSKFAARAASDALPMRDAFAVLFFVSVGMGFDPTTIWEHGALLLATVVLTVLGASLVCYITLRLLKAPFRKAVTVAATLTQIGEFSFILASLAASEYGVLPQEAANVITGVAIITITLNAACFRFVPGLIDALEARGIGVAHEGAHELIPDPTEDRDRVIVVGYGPCGEICARLLRENEVEAVVVEMNIDTVGRLNQAGIPALHGDARRRAILEAAGVEKAVSIIITSPAAPAMEIATMARSLNPDIYVMAHTQYLLTAQQLRGALQDQVAVYSGENEVALTMMSHLLTRLHATVDQVSRELRRARKLLDQVGILPAKPSASTASPASSSPNSPPSPNSSASGS